MTLTDIAKAAGAHAAPRTDQTSDAPWWPALAKLAKAVRYNRRPITLTREEARAIVDQAAEADLRWRALLSTNREQARVIAQLREKAEADRVALAAALTPRPVTP